MEYSERGWKAMTNRELMSKNIAMTGLLRLLAGTDRTRSHRALVAS